MTREEAIKTLKDRIEQYTGGVHPGEREILLEALAAMRGPQPDPDTGLAPCGCGGKARIEESPFADDVDNVGLKIYMVGCAECTIGFEGYFISIEDAQEHWNTAMGWRGKE